MIKDLDSSKPTPTKVNVGDFIFMFLGPTLVGKSMIIYCGLNYSSYPGEGFGWGLVGAIVFTLATVGRFLWKYRNYVD